MIKRVGFDFIDVYQRSGIYPLSLPYSIGMEGVGVVGAIGEGVENITIGDQVSSVMGPPGGQNQEDPISQEESPWDRIRPPTRSRASKRQTLRPTFCNCKDAVSPLIPAPTTKISITML